MNKFSLMLRSVLGALGAVVVFLTGAWGALALWYQLPGGSVGRALGSVVWALLVVALVALAISRRSLWPLAGYGLAMLVLLIWWWNIPPSNHRVWADDVAHLLRGEVHGHRVTLHNVRDFDWRSDSDYDARWETRDYDLDHLVSADAILSYWDSRAIAHAMISFGFDDGRHVVFSVEIRKKKGEAFSEIGGFFKQFEMVLVAADEHDIVRVRTNVRGEDDYLYPMTLERETMRALFLSYVEAANRLAERPAFYNTITSNCTTLVYRMARQLNPGLPMDIRLLLTGYLQGYLRDNGAIDASQPADVQRAAARITDKARRTGPTDDFSRAIRAPR
ncbi:MAG: Lnb N-terminal periplasmic domain-containing protein [Dyella sp.]|uniref:Lnb N-terminal periplasmic domain-containing protein n=1 Tax=Dyella sp. TaxID=1869338 RepID=UPI003F7F69B6